MVLTTEHFPLTGVAPRTTDVPTRSTLSFDDHRRNDVELIAKDSLYQRAVLSVPMGVTTPIYDGGGPQSSSVGSDLEMELEKYRYFIYAFVGAFLLIFITLISGTVYLCLQRRKKIDELRHRLIPVYTFDPGEEEWGGLLDNQEEESKFRDHSKT